MTDKTITILNQAIELDRQEVNYWKQKQCRNRKIVRNFIRDSEQSLNNIIELRQVLTQTPYNNENSTPNS